ncbi:hypothetical protein [Allochromatium palmeri]|uniref:Uncharacterized protein n=1 Tax=Allochromatium palmeri TaxID=231048 RepID=A0A6N8ECV6_9GAMM|nr:hypothetical protein [Allochromatium palmeri]MTW21340.1 hypothetical protein [Allochromatium palmeri]
MPFTTLLRGALWSLLLMLLTFGTVQADPIAEVERILDDIRQDRPVPRLDYLHPVAPMNPGCALFEGQYGAVTLQVETHPDSPRVASLLLRIPGPDQTRALLPTVSRVLGAPHSQDRRQSVYGWDWPEYRAASLHYVPGGSGTPGQTIMSLFYR